MSRRGQGESWGAIARHLQEQGVLPAERKAGAFSLAELSEALTANLVLGQAGSRTSEQLVADWPTMTMAEKRAVLRAYVERVSLTRADPKRRCWQPIGERTQLEWVAAPASRGV